MKILIFTRFRVKFIIFIENKFTVISYLNVVEKTKKIDSYTPIPNASRMHSLGNRERDIKLHNPQHIL